MGTELIRIWFCDCGPVHIETRHCRKSYTPAEFLNCLRNAAGQGGAEATPPRTSRLNQACEVKPAIRAAHQLIGVKAA